MKKKNCTTLPRAHLCVCGIQRAFPGPCGWDTVVVALVILPSRSLGSPRSTFSLISALPGSSPLSAPSFCVFQCSAPLSVRWSRISNAMRPLNIVISPRTRQWELRVPSSQTFSGTHHVIGARLPAIVGPCLCTTDSMSDRSIDESGPSSATTSCGGFDGPAFSPACASACTLVDRFLRCSVPRHGVPVPRCTVVSLSHTHRNLLLLSLANALRPNST